MDLIHAIFLSHSYAEINCLKKVQKQRFFVGAAVSSRIGVCLTSQL